MGEENWDLRIAGCVIKIAGDDVGGALAGKLRILPRK
jgi:hypothetical protein